MFKKLNQYLLTHYPLLWNTRVVYVVPAALLIHLLFFLGGYSKLIDAKDFWKSYHFDVTEVTVFSILVSLMLIIVWLVFYLRNNAFKSFYRQSRWYLVGELGIMFLVFFSSATFFLSYKQGVYSKVQSITSSIDAVHKANRINLAAHFLPFNLNNFKSWQSCEVIKSNNPQAEEEGDYTMATPPDYD